MKFLEKFLKTLGYVLGMAVAIIALKFVTRGVGKALFSSNSADPIAILVVVAGCAGVVFLSIKAIQWLNSPSKLP